MHSEFPRLPNIEKVSGYLRNVSNFDLVCALQEVRKEDGDSEIAWDRLIGREIPHVSTTGMVFKAVDWDAAIVVAAKSRKFDVERALKSRQQS